MADIIKLLPDSIANQIAAGEVIQRPASVVKELLENAVDAGSSHIKLIIKDAGKTSIQVIDDGKGMSETDARMSFQRHATSKINTANDLFCIKTMGFRGEALASIAAISHVEMFTRTLHEEVANHLVMEGSVIKKQGLQPNATGTNITVKNLFYNVPARRKFLKSDPVELKHIIDEFLRVCLANPDIYFSFHHNGNELYHLPKANLRQRIVGVLGKQINEKLIPLNEETEVATFTGFVGKPEASKKTQGDQYIFVNKRFIKSPYLNHAIRAAYEDLITKEVFPTFFVFLELDPNQIDINVHPTKTEIKFEDERLIYNYLRVTIKHSLGQYSLTPMLDFNIDQNFAYKFSNEAPKTPLSTLASSKTSFPIENEAIYRANRPNVTGWEEIYQSVQKNADQPEQNNTHITTIESEAFQMSIEEENNSTNSGQKEPYQLHNTYILHQVKSGLMMIDQQAAHERILYELYLDRFKSGEYISQKELFPITIDVSPSNAHILSEILPFVRMMGFEIEPFGQDTFIIHATPSGLETNQSLVNLIEKLVLQYTQNLEFELGIEDNLARSMAISAGIKKGKKLEKVEMTAIIDQLFACQLPYKSPSGKNCFILLEHDEFLKRFNH